MKPWEQDSCIEWIAIPGVHGNYGNKNIYKITVWVWSSSHRTIIYPLQQSEHIILIQEIFLYEFIYLALKWFFKEFLFVKAFRSWVKEFHLLGKMKDGRLRRDDFLQICKAMLFVLRELNFLNMLSKQEGSLLWTKECINNLLFKSNKSLNFRIFNFLNIGLVWELYLLLLIFRIHFFWQLINPFSFDGWTPPQANKPNSIWGLNNPL